MQSASISNALIRCTRTDDKAAAAEFEPVRKDLGLWVLELATEEEAEWSSQMSSICVQLSKLLPELSDLAEDSRDFTLHLSVLANNHVSAMIPPELSEIAAQCGFGIEIYFDSGT